MADLLRGSLLVFFIVGLAGAIAYVGDRVGHQVGRKRLSLFGIRPRYTSTIVAIGTGMLIALVVVVGSILASNSVKTAFFHLNAVNTRVTQLQAQEEELQRHVRNEQVVAGVGDMVTPEYIVLRQGEPPDERYRDIRAFFYRAVDAANSYFVPRGLKKYVPPPDIDKKIRDYANQIDFSAALSQFPVVVIAVTEENLFPNDPVQVHFRQIKDTLVFPKGAPIASFVVAANPNNSVTYIVSGLEELVTQSAVRNGMSPFVFAQAVKLAGGPPPALIEQMLRSRHGTYQITASAATNIYPHTGGVPVVLSLTPRK